MKNKDSQDNLVRKASTPYKLLLDEQTKLPKLDDLISVDDPELPKFTYFSYTPVHFKGRTLTIRSRYHYAESYDQHIILIKDYLLVYCDCDAEVSGLCPHLIELFARLNKERKHGYFEKYKLHPFTDTAFYDQYLKLESNYDDTKAVPKPEYGHIYNYEDGIDADCFIPDTKFCLTPAKSIEEDPSFAGYAIAYAYYASIPFLVPFSAILNYERTAIRTFECFTDPAVVPDRLSLEQKLLHSYSLDFNSLLDFENIHKMYRNEASEINQMRQMTFYRWKEVIPLLKAQKYLFCHTFNNKLNYKSRPSKQSMRPVVFADDPVTFRFLLTEYEGHFKLQCKAWMSGQDFEVDTVVPEAHPFFFSLKHAPEVHYQFSNLEEGQAISEFVKSGGIFTILKQDFEEFNASILSKLALKYAVTHHWLKKRELLVATIAAKQIRVEDQGDYVAFIPTFVYSYGLNVAVNSAGNETLHFTNGTFQVVERDKTAETEFKNYFMKLEIPLILTS